MWDQTVEYHDLAMVCSDLNVPSRPLPDGFGYRGFQPGDEHHWAEIERSAGEFTNLTDALARFDQDFGADQAELGRRMLFLTTASGEAIGTATAWFDQGVGQLYWVGVDQRYQRRGFARPLVAHTMRRLWQLGHRQAKLSTQTPSWVAVRVYLSLGWQPYDDGQPDYVDGWRVIDRLTPGAVAR